MLLTSEEFLMDETKINFDFIFNTKVGRNFFAKNVYLTKFKEKKNHCLSNKNFEQMFKIISSAIMSIIVEENTKDFNDGILLTSCLFRYYKVAHGKSLTFLYHQIAQKKGIFNLWKNPNFWLKYIEVELRGEDYFTLLSSLVFKMHDLNIDTKIMTGIIIDNFTIKFMLNVN